MLAEPGYTPYDLNFRIGSIPVRVHPLFWLISAVLGWSFIQIGFQYVLMWIACVFVSILIHEMGHVLMGMQFGRTGHIVLYSFGGLAVGSYQLGHRWQRIAVSLAGPGAQFVFLGVIWLVSRSLSDRSTMQREVLFQLWWINLAWPVLNLVPIWPLDGGQVARELFVAGAGQNGIRYSLILSVFAAVAAGILVYLWTESGYNLVLFGLLAFGSVQLLQDHSGPRGGPPRRETSDDRAPWERDADYWKQ